MSPEKLDLCKNILLKSPFFGSLDLMELENLLAYTRTKSYKQNEIIFNKGDKGGQFYAILSGTIMINALSAEGEEINIRILEKGDFFGEIAMFDHELRSAKAIMHSTGELLIIEQNKCKKFLEQTPKISFKLIMSLCSRLRQTTELLEDTLFLKLPVRLAKRILVLAEKYGVEKQGTIFINLKLSQTELGNCVHCSRESINKLIKEWKQSEIIDFKNGYITIKDMESLDNM